MYVHFQRCKPRDKFAESLPTEDIWLVSKDNLEVTYNIKL